MVNTKYSKTSLRNKNFLHITIFGVGVGYTAKDTPFLLLLLVFFLVFLFPGKINLILVSLIMSFGLVKKKKKKRRSRLGRLVSGEPISKLSFS